MPVPSTHGDARQTRRAVHAPSRIIKRVLILLAGSHLPEEEVRGGHRADADVHIVRESACTPPIPNPRESPLDETLPLPANSMKMKSGSTVANPEAMPTPENHPQEKRINECIANDKRIKSFHQVDKTDNKWSKGPQCGSKKRVCGSRGEAGTRPAKNAGVSREGKGKAKPGLQKLYGGCMGTWRFICLGIDGRSVKRVREGRHRPTESNAPIQNPQSGANPK
ncbi:hypothetical protein K438DRAFT_1751362 [Mycena galopus ATCC 62051]|nr:hypothetical protein K438DRAFT_1751362 [Mycena galopus ATCC 62051]